MTVFRLEDGLPFITLVLHSNTQSITLDKVLVDTGSSTCVFKMIDIIDMGIRFDGTERIQTMIGVGGDEHVLEKEIDSIEIGGKFSGRWTIHVGSVGYGFGIQGIIGSDLLLALGVIIDYRAKTLSIP